MKKIFTLLLLICAFSFQKISAQSTTVVISQIYGGGGNSGAVYTNDFVELFNLSSVPQDISNWQIAYGSAPSGVSWINKAKIPTGTIMPAKTYFLIQLTAGMTTFAALPTPDLIGIINLSASNGKLALINDTTTLSGVVAPTPVQNPTTLTTGVVIDFVGFGTAANYEGAAAAPAPANATAIIRSNGGLTDTNNNGADFTVAAPAPRNSSNVHLPIKLSAFNAVGLKSTVNLSWLTNVDQDGGKFDIERSVDASSFENISTINANSLGNASYEMTDRNLPNVKTLYYRLKIINADGSFIFSNVQKVTLKDIKLSVSPNPASTEILVNATENIKSVELYDIRGRRMMVKENINLNQTRVNVTSLIEGTYLVKTTSGGETTTTQVLIKH